MFGPSTVTSSQYDAVFGFRSSIAPPIETHNANNAKKNASTCGDCGQIGALWRSAWPNNNYFFFNRTSVTEQTKTKRERSYLRAASTRRTVARHRWSVRNVRLPRVVEQETKKNVPTHDLPANAKDFRVRQLRNKAKAEDA